MIVARLLSLLIGYAFGLFQTAYIYGRSKGIDIRDKGSGNAGTTNSIRVLGWKAGALTFLGDFLKAVFAVLVVKFLFRQTYGEAVKVLELYAGFGAVLGHNYPFYLQFKGGKGIACSGGVVVAVCPLAAPIGIAFFILPVLITKYVSLGSILALFSYLVQVIIFGQLGYLNLTASLLIEFYILSACFTAMAVWKHRENIKRLLNGTENKIGSKKKEEGESK